MCNVIKKMHDVKEPQWYECITATLITILDNFAKDTTLSDKESYLNTLTVIICTAPVEATAVTTVSF